MKKCLLILFLLPFSLVLRASFDNNFYLIDSLPLTELTKEDKILLDSCLNVYHTATEDTVRIKAFSDICDNMAHKMWSSYQLFQYELIEQALKKDITAEERLTIQHQKTDALHNIGLYYEFDQSNISVAMDHYLKALKLYEILKDKNGEAMMLSRIGNVHSGQGNLKKGLDYHRKSLALYKTLGEDKGMSAPINSIGLYYQKADDPDKALSFFRQSLDIELKFGNKQEIGMLYNNIGYAYMLKKEYSKALISLIKGLVIFEEVGLERGKCLILKNIGYVYLSQGDDKSAYINAKQSFDIAKNIGFPKNIGAASLLLSKVYEKQKKHAKALEMFKLHKTMQDSLSNDSTRSIAVEQHMKYEYEKQKAVDDVVYLKQLAIEKESREKQKIIMYAIIFGICSLAIFFVFVVRRWRVERKQKVIIESANKELSQKNKEILYSINYAKRIQTAILPPEKLMKQYLENSFVLYRPKDIVAGDFYWMKRVGDKKETILFAVADCTGHGVPGAMVSVVCNNALNLSIREYGLVDPAKILDKTREIVIAEFSETASNDNGEDYVQDGMDIALCSLTGNKLSYAGANNPLWIVRDGAIIIAKANKQPIGSFRSSVAFTTHNIDLQKGDIIYIFSDGYVDQFGGVKDKKFKATAFKELLLSVQDESMENQQFAINKAFDAWKGGNEQVDDVCIIGVRY